MGQVSLQNDEDRMQGRGNKIGKQSFQENVQRMNLHMVSRTGLAIGSSKTIFSVTKSAFCHRTLGKEPKTEPNKPHTKSLKHGKYGKTTPVATGMTLIDV